MWRKYLTPYKSVSKTRAVTQRGTAAFSGHVMITMFFHRLIDAKLFDAVRGAETTVRVYIAGGATVAGSEAALPQDRAAGCLALRACRKRSAFLKDLLVLHGHEGAL